MTYKVERNKPLPEGYATEEGFPAHRRFPLDDGYYPFHLMEIGDSFKFPTRAHSFVLKDARRYQRLLKAERWAFLIKQVTRGTYRIWRMR